MIRPEHSSVKIHSSAASKFAPFLIGLPLAAGILYLFHSGPFQDTAIQRYVSHPIEWAAIILFCCGIGAFTAKLLRYGFERLALRNGLLPQWDGKPAPVKEADRLWGDYVTQPYSYRSTYFGQRIAAVLDFLRKRKSTADLDDHLRTLSDNDHMAVESGSSLVRFIIWAVPILGFLGTVLGITGAVAGITPEVLDQSLSKVTDGLALAFDTTAVALALTLVLMFVHSVVDRMEQSLVDLVDHAVDQQLAHRFERVDGNGSEIVDLVRQNSESLMQSMEKLVERQAAIWAETFAKMEAKRNEAEVKLHDRLQTALASALERTLEAHSLRVAEVEKHTVHQVSALTTKLEHLGKLGERLEKQTAALTRLQEGEQQMLRLQKGLNDNLETLAGTAAFEQAVHSLTAAVHMLTSQSVAGRIRKPGAAA